MFPTQGLSLHLLHAGGFLTAECLTVQHCVEWASLLALWSRIHLLIQVMQVQSLVQEDPFEKEMVTYSSILAWEIPWIEEPGGLQSNW